MITKNSVILVLCTGILAAVSLLIFVPQNPAFISAVPWMIAISVYYLQSKDAKKREEDKVLSDTHRNIGNLISEGSKLFWKFRLANQIQLRLSVEDAEKYDECTKEHRKLDLPEIKINHGTNMEKIGEIFDVVFNRRYAEDITARLVAMESTKLILDVSHFTDSLELSEYELKAEFKARGAEIPDKLDGVMKELCKILDQCKELQGDLNNVELRYTIANECYRICRQSRGLFYEYLRTCSNPEQILNEPQADAMDCGSEHQAEVQSS